MALICIFIISYDILLYSRDILIDLGAFIFILRNMENRQFTKYKNDQKNKWNRSNWLHGCSITLLIQMVSILVLSINILKIWDILKKCSGDHF